MRRVLITMFLTAVIGMIGAGCSDNPSTPDTSIQEPDLQEDFGGYDFSAEKVAFGNDELVAETEDIEGDEYDDPIMYTPYVDSLASDSLGTFYHLRVLWGQLRYDSSVTTATDWTGTLTVDGGVVVVRRTIRFELGQDYIPTRTDSSVVDWVSYTTVHHDGLCFAIYVPAETDPNDVTVNFSSLPYSRSLTLDEITSLDTIVYLDDVDSNAVAMWGFQFRPRACARGELMGHWGYDENGDGVFYGVWMTRWGWASGYVEGIFGLDEEDSMRVFYGKWINLDGTCEGLIRGTYGPRPNYHANEQAQRRAGGWFAGYIYSSDEEEIGVLKGRYRSHPEAEEGFLAGRWKLRCFDVVDEPDDAEEGF